MFTYLATPIFMFFLSALDIWSYFFLELHSCYFLLAFLIAYYWYHNSSFIMSAGILLLVTESYIAYPAPLFSLLVIVPLFAIIHAMKYRMYLTLLQPIVTLAVAIIADIVVGTQVLKTARSPHPIQ